MRKCPIDDSATGVVDSTTAVADSIEYGINSTTPVAESATGVVDSATGSLPIESRPCSLS